MKNRFSLYLLCAVFFLGPAFAEGLREDPERQAQAQKALELRLSYAASADYDPYSTADSDVLKKARGLYQEQKLQEAIDEAAKGLKKYKYNIDLLILQASAYRKLEIIDKADEIRRQWFALMDSILNSGDGRGFDTAYKVITIAEEYTTLRLLGLEVVSQSLVGNKGSAFDVMTVKDAKSGEKFAVYFNIDLINKWLDKTFNAKE